LYRQILEPALRAVVGKTTLILVPDGPLYAVPFSALSSTTDSTPLVARFAIGMAPSLTAYLVASARLAHADFDSVVAIGDGHSPSKSQLPVLPMANQEARAVGNLYPQRVVLTGGAATKHQILSHQAAVIHFSGHTIVNVQHPMMSKLLLAPDPDDNNSDGLLMSDITRERFGTARVVTLATCDGAAGHFVEGEGVVSVARAFFAAGVPSVVASLWQADDNAMDLLTAFHRELRVRRDAVAALRAAQLLWLRDHHERDAVRAWAGYVALGGTMTLD
jgi:CHAT domain-containing protein